MTKTVRRHFMFFPPALVFFLLTIPSQQIMAFQSVKAVPQKKEQQKMIPAHGDPSLLEAGTHRGKVLTTMDSGGYTYVEFEEKGNNLWAAAPVFPISKGDVIEFVNPLLMKNFQSRKLGRTFSEIYFVNKINILSSADPKTRIVSLPESHVPVSGNPKTDFVVDAGSVEKAEGGHTVEECFSRKDELNGETVVVRGRVVKFIRKILGRNWLHLKDGTGVSPSDDLTVTTKQVVEVGDLVLIKGKMSVDKDFGYGYFYPVIIEEAELIIEKK
ncbi:MAG: hypothetical protein MUP70_14235 [Candidatus Aminicenantes bacterium]|nr:hypothetical protein [Candidatus Aminicenantes bacterium]